MNDQTVPAPSLEFDGERFVPGAGVEITYHHWLRYFFAAQMAPGKRVLDIASGEGYGAAYLAGVAQWVRAFDVSATAVAHATMEYARVPNLTFERNDIETFFAAAQAGSYDLVTAFEIIEHVDERTQQSLLDGIRRVLSPDGLAFISTPDKRIYSDAKLSKNPFHVRELHRTEFARLVENVFPVTRYFEQDTATSSVIFEQGADHGAFARIGWTDLLKLKGKCEPGLSGSGEYLLAVVALAAAPAERLNSVALVDLSKKLIAEHLYAQHLELETARRDSKALQDRLAQFELETARRDSKALQDRLAQLQLENERRTLQERLGSLEEASFRLQVMEALADRLTAAIGRNQDDVTRGQRAEAELAQAKHELEHLRHLLHAETVRRSALEDMVSLRLIFRAKKIWDRAPRLKSAVKSVVKSFM